MAILTSVEPTSASTISGEPGLRKKVRGDDGGLDDRLVQSFNLRPRLGIVDANGAFFRTEANAFLTCLRYSPPVKIEDLRIGR